MEYDERLLKLSRYIKETIEGLGLSQNAFWKKYCRDRDGKSIVPPTTLRNLVTDLQSFPSSQTIAKFAPCLDRARRDLNLSYGRSHEEVTATFLMQMIGLGMEGDREEVEAIDASDVRADMILRQYLALPFFEQMLSAVPI